MTLSTQLWSENSDLASEALTHPFVCRLGDGSLAREIFAGYLAQDAFFLESSPAPTPWPLLTAPTHPRCSRWPICSPGYGRSSDCTPPTPPGGASTWPASSLHRRPWPTEFLLATAATGGVGMVFAAMTPCMRLYAWLGAALDAGAAGPYAQWVQTYADPSFEALASRLERLLDEHADDRPAVRAAYRRAMHLELAFFDAALLPSG